MKGAYVLLFVVKKNFSIRVGSLGRLSFEKGCYAYVGSARSSLFPRLERHFARRKKVNWHIDYLTTRRLVVVKKAIYSLEDSKEIECRLSAQLSMFSKAVPHFGSSDCKEGCPSHLYFLKTTLKRAEVSILGIFANEGLTALSYQNT